MNNSKPKNDKCALCRGRIFFESLGITLSDAINLFLHQSLREGGLPFEVKRADTKKTQE
ncbi:MAG: type II toxin-antitoxin system RelB/DinJ family antitoxin [Peptococcaceae bacterium]|nr:type II toxin-antitoxin system RelB/DinJ family antitoxin [Peptococcaceae bacterium]